MAHPFDGAEHGIGMESSHRPTGGGLRGYGGGEVEICMGAGGGRGGGRGGGSGGPGGDGAYDGEMSVVPSPKGVALLDIQSSESDPAHPVIVSAAVPVKLPAGSTASLDTFKEGIIKLHLASATKEKITDTDTGIILDTAARTLRLVAQAVKHVHQGSVNDILAHAVHELTSASLVSVNVASSHHTHHEVLEPPQSDTEGDRGAWDDVSGWEDVSARDDASEGSDASEREDEGARGDVSEVEKEAEWRKEHVAFSRLIPKPDHSCPLSPRHGKRRRRRRPVFQGAGRDT